MTKFRKATRQIHLWLGLVTGLIVFIVSITGCLFVFQKEISDLVHKKTFFVQPPAQKTQLPFSYLLEQASTALGKDKPINYTVTYKDPARAWEFMTYKAGDPKALTYFGSLAHYESVFINPYDGKITGHYDYKYDFFNIIKYLHWGLLLNPDYGQYIVGYSTLIFVFMLITGMILWWPKKWSKTNIKKSFTIKWDASFKRLNYDLHNVPGFYTMFITLILALSGLVYALPWFQKTVYVIAARTFEQPDVKYEVSTPAPFTGKPLDRIFIESQKLFKETDRIAVSPPLTEEAAVFVTGLRGKEVYYDFDVLQFDQYSAKLLNRRNYDEMNAGEKLSAMNYDIHVGAILGLPGKILALIGGLVAASLPISGLMIWLGRKKKNKKQK